MRIRHVTDPETGKVWPIQAGGADDNPTPEPSDDQPADAPPDDGGGDDPDDVAAGSKRAVLADLAAERKRRQAEEKKAAELEAELDKLREEAMSEQEKALKKAREEAASEARDEVLEEVNRKLFAAEVRAAAAGKVADPDLLADPDVALKLLGIDEVPVDDGGNVDTEAISEALDVLVQSKPYLAVGDRQPVPDADQGARGTNGVKQLTREQLKSMTPEQITEAEQEGRLDKVLGRS